MTAALNDILRRTSRSFYLTLRILPRAVRPQIALAYLLARTSDTIADTAAVPVEQRLDALREFRAAILTSAKPQTFDGLASEQVSASERDLLQKPPEALAALQSLSPDDQRLVRDVLATIISGQELDLRRFATVSSERIVALKTAAELDDYTYRVAGCVGEFWTKICRAHLFPRAALDDAQLIADAIRFGNGLQLVNILRDVPADLANGRCYLPLVELEPLGLRPEALLAPEHEPKFLALYRRHLDDAEANLRAGWRYTNALPYTQFRVRLACAWPILIGLRTLARLRAANVDQLQQGIKISRAEVRSIMLRSLLACPLPFAWQRLM
jgi:farnesyl-diphosphate farnesyltransferase